MISLPLQAHDEGIALHPLTSHDFDSITNYCRANQDKLCHDPDDYKVYHDEAYPLLAFNF